MRKFLLGTVSLVALGMAAPALAADLPAQTYTKAPVVVPPPVYNWSGFYIGINGGWGQNRDCRTDAVTGVAFGCHEGDGGVAGGQIGYRWQTGGGWVFGLEAQGDWANLQGSNVSLINPLVSIRSNMDAFGLFTGQIGYAWNNALFYVKGGGAVTDTRFDSFVNATGALDTTAGYQTNWGATVGAGFEYGFAPNWSVGVEYDHIFRTSNDGYTFTTAAGVPLADPHYAGGDTDLVTARINYRFGGPVVARY
jgi:outer membrane immunogenic protein